MYQIQCFQTILNTSKLVLIYNAKYVKDNFLKLRGASYKPNYFSLKSINFSTYLKISRIIATHYQENNEAHNGFV